MSKIVIYDRFTNDRYSFNEQSTKKAVEQLIKMINEKYLNEKRLVVL